MRLIRAAERAAGREEELTDPGVRKRVRTNLRGGRVLADAMERAEELVSSGFEQDESTNRKLDRDSLVKLFGSADGVAEDEGIPEVAPMPVLPDTTIGQAPPPAAPLPHARQRLEEEAVPLTSLRPSQPARAKKPKPPIRVNDETRQVLRDVIDELRGKHGARSGEVTTIRRAPTSDAGSAPREARPRLRAEAAPLPPGAPKLPASSASLPPGAPALPAGARDELASGVDTEPMPGMPPSMPPPPRGDSGLFRAPLRKRQGVRPVPPEVARAMPSAPGRSERDPAATPAPDALQEQPDAPLPVASELTEDEATERIAVAAAQGATDSARGASLPTGPVVGELPGAAIGSIDSEPDDASTSGGGGTADDGPRLEFEPLVVVDGDAFGTAEHLAPTRLQSELRDSTLPRDPGMQQHLQTRAIRVVKPGARTRWVVWGSIALAACVVAAVIALVAYSPSGAPGDGSSGGPGSGSSAALAGGGSSAVNKAAATSDAGSASVRNDLAARGSAAADAGAVASATAAAGSGSSSDAATGGVHDAAAGSTASAAGASRADSTASGTGAGSAASPAGGSDDGDVRAASSPSARRRARRAARRARARARARRRARLRRRRARLRRYRRRRRRRRRQRRRKKKQLERTIDPFKE